MYVKALNSHENLIPLSKARPSRQQDSWRSCGFPFPAGVTESNQSARSPLFAEHVFSSTEDILGEVFIGEVEKFSLHSLPCLTLHISNKLKEPS